MESSVYKCIYCGEYFNNDDDLKNHLLNARELILPADDVLQLEKIKLTINSCLNEPSPILDEAGTRKDCAGCSGTCKHTCVVNCNDNCQGTCWGSTQ